MEEDRRDNMNIFYIFLLVISLILFAADFLELYQLITQWHIGLKLDIRVFQECVKFQLFFKTAFVFFNLIISTFTLILVIFLMKSTEFLINKILPAIMDTVAVIFGPYLLVLCLLGIHYWDYSVYTCEKHNIKQKKFVGANCFNLIFFAIFSLIITLYNSISNAFYHIAYSITKPNYKERSYIIRKLFWYMVFKYIRREEVVRHALGLNGQQDQLHEQA